MQEQGNRKNLGRLPTGRRPHRIRHQHEQSIRRRISRVRILQVFIPDHSSNYFNDVPDHTSDTPPAHLYNDDSPTTKKYTRLKNCGTEIIFRRNSTNRFVPPRPERTPSLHPVPPHHPSVVWCRRYCSLPRLSFPQTPFPHDLPTPAQTFSTTTQLPPTTESDSKPPSPPLLPLRPDLRPPRGPAPSA